MIRVIDEAQGITHEFPDEATEDQIQEVLGLRPAKPVETPKLEEPKFKSPTQSLSRLTSVPKAELPTFSKFNPSAPESVEGQLKLTQPEAFAPPPSPRIAKGEEMRESLSRLREESLKQAKPGIVSATPESSLDVIPFLSGAKQLGDMIGLWWAANRINDGRYTAEDEALLADYMAKQRRSQEPGTIGRDIAQVLWQLPSFAGELMGTSGVFSGTKAAVTKTLESAFKKVAANKAGALATKVLSTTSGATAQAPFARGLEMAAGTVERKLPEISVTPEGVNLDYSKVPTTGEAIYKSIGNEWAEVWSERTGGGLKAAGNAIGRGISKLVPAAKIPFEKVAQFRDAIVKDWLKLNPGKTVKDFADAFADKAAWNGYWGEIGEERIADIAKAILGIEPLRPVSELPRQVGVEMAAFAVPGAGGMVAKVGGQAAVNQYQSRTPINQERFEAARNAYEARFAPALPRIREKQKPTTEVPSANQIQSPVAVGGGQPTGPAAQVAEGKPGDVFAPQGEGEAQKPQGAKPEPSGAEILRIAAALKSGAETTQEERDWFFQNWGRANFDPEAEEMPDVSWNRFLDNTINRFRSQVRPDYNPDDLRAWMTMERRASRDPAVAARISDADNKFLWDYFLGSRMAGQTDTQKAFDSALAEIRGRVFNQPKGGVPNAEEMQGRKETLTPTVTFKGWQPVPSRLQGKMGTHIPIWNVTTSELPDGTDVSNNWFEKRGMQVPVPPTPPPPGTTTPTPTGSVPATPTPSEGVEPTSTTTTPSVTPPKPAKMSQEEQDFDHELRNAVPVLQKWVQNAEVTPEESRKIQDDLDAINLRMINSDTPDWIAGRQEVKDYVNAWRETVKTRKQAPAPAPVTPPAPPVAPAEAPDPVTPPAPTPAAPLKKAKVKIPNHPHGIYDIIDAVHEFGGIKPPPKVATNAGDYDGFPAIKNYRILRLLIRETGQKPDQLVGEVASKIWPDMDQADITPDMLWDELIRAATERDKAKKEVSAQGKVAKLLALLGVSKRNKHGIPANQFNVDDTFTINGQKVTVTFKDNLGNIAVKHPKMGTADVEAAFLIHPDPKSIKRAPKLLIVSGNGTVDTFLESALKEHRELFKRLGVVLRPVDTNNADEVTRMADTGGFMFGVGNYDKAEIIYEPEIVSDMIADMTDDERRSSVSRAVFHELIHAASRTVLIKEYHAVTAKKDRSYDGFVAFVLKQADAMIAEMTPEQKVATYKAYYGFGSLDIMEDPDINPSGIDAVIAAMGNGRVNIPIELVRMITEINRTQRTDEEVRHNEIKIDKNKQPIIWSYLSKVLDQLKQWAKDLNNKVKGTFGPVLTAHIENIDNVLRGREPTAVAEMQQAGAGVTTPPAPKPPAPSPPVPAPPTPPRVPAPQPGPKKPASDAAKKVISANADLIRKIKEGLGGQQLPPSGMAKAAASKPPLAELSDEVTLAALKLGNALVKGGVTDYAEYHAAMVEALGDQALPWIQMWYESNRANPMLRTYSFTPQSEVQAYEDSLTVQPEAAPEKPTAPDRSGLEQRQPGGTPSPGAGQQARKPLITAREEVTPTNIDTSIIPGDLNPFLDEHQKLGASMAIYAMRDQGGFLIADGTGVGKTFEALAVARYWMDQGNPVIIVSVNEALGKPRQNNNQISGTYKFAAERMGIPYRFTLDPIPDPTTIQVTTYENIGAVSDRVTPQTILIFDESHALKNAESQRSSEARKALQNAKAVLYMTATPADKPEHIYYLNRMGILEGKTEEEAYRDLGMLKVEKKIKNRKTGRENKIVYWTIDPRVGASGTIERFEQLFRRMTQKGLMIKREISMEGMRVVFDEVKLPPEAHDTMARIAEFLEGVPLAKMRIPMQQRLQQEPFKIDRVIERTKQELAEGRKVVIFVHRVNESEVRKKIKLRGFSGEVVDEYYETLMKSEGTAKTLKERLQADGITDIVEIHGEADTNAAHAMDQFQNGTPRVVIATIASGGTGINLDDNKGGSPRSMIVVTSPFSSVEVVQALGRIWRLMTKGDARAFMMFGDTDVDRWNAGIIGAKMKTLHATVEGQVAQMDVTNPDMVSVADYERMKQGQEPVGNVPNLPKLDWKEFKTRAGKIRYVAPATAEFWTWYKANPTQAERLGLRPSKWQNVWQVWADKIPESGGIPPAGMPRAPKPIFSAGELAAIARAYSNWKDWYASNKVAIDALFGEDANLFLDFLAATSPNTSVAANVALALKAYGQHIRGEPFVGYLPAIIPNLQRAAKRQLAEGQKVQEFNAAVRGVKDAVAIDRHMARLMFGPKAKKPTPQQVRLAIEMIREAARMLGWEPRQTQAAIWGAYIVKTGSMPKGYEDYLTPERTGPVLDAARSAGRRVGTAVPRGDQPSTEPGGEGQGRPGYPRQSGIPPAGTGSANPEEARNAIALAKDALAREIEAKHQLGQSVDLVDAMDRNGAKTVSPASQARLRYSDLSGIEAAGEAALGRREGYLTLRSGLDPYQTKWMARIANQWWAMWHREADNTLKEYEQEQARIAGPGFTAKIKRLGVLKADRDFTEVILTTTESVLSSAMYMLKKALDAERITEAETNRLQGELDGLKDAMQSSTAMQQLLNDMITVLSGVPAGQALLTVPNPGNRTAIINLYTQIKKAQIAAAGGGNLHSQNLINWAAYLLSRDSEVKDLLLASRMASSAPVRAAMNAFQTKFAADWEADPVKALKDVLRTERKLTTDAERAKFAWQQLHQELMRELAQFKVLEDAAAVAKATMEDPQTKALWKEIQKDAGHIGIQEPVAPFIRDTIVLPSGGEVSIGTSEMIGGKTYFDSKRAQWDAAVRELQLWLQDPDNYSDPNFGTHEQNLNTLLTYYMGLTVMQPNDQTHALKKTYDVLKFVGKQVKGRVAAQYDLAIANFDAAGYEAAKWQQRWSFKMMNARIDAMKSHGLKWGGLSKTTYAGANLVWWDKIGNALAASHSRQQGGYKVGDWVNGWQVTEADLRDLKTQSDAVTAAFDIAKQFRQVTKDTLFGVTTWRGAIKGSPLMVTRLPDDANLKAFASKLIEMVDAYNEALRTRDPRIILPARDRLVALINTYWHTGIGRALIEDRNPQFATMTPFDGPAGAFKILANRMDRNPRAVGSFDDFLNELASLSGMTVEDSEAIVLKEWKDFAKKLWTEFKPETKVGFVAGDYRKNAFTRSRNDLMGPYAFYEHGFRDYNSVARFASSIYSWQIDQVTAALRAMELDIDRQQDEYESAVAVERARGTPDPEAAVRERNTIQRANGETYDVYKDFELRKHFASSALHMLTQDFANMNIPLTMGRYISAMVQGVMGTMATSRNVIMGPRYIGTVVIGLTASNLQAGLLSPWYGWIDTAIKVLPFYGVGALKAITYDFIRGTWNAGKQAVLNKDQRTVVAFLHNMLKPMLVEVSETMFQRIGTYRRMQKAGIEHSTKVADEFTARMFGSMIMQGRTGEEEMSLFHKIKLAPVALWETFPMLFMRGTMPYAGDVGLNIGVYDTLKSALGPIASLQRRLADLYTLYGKGPRFNYKNPLDPKNLFSHKEIFPVSIKSLRFVSSADDMTRLRDLFIEAGMNFDQKAMEYLAALDAKSQNAQFLTEAERERFALAMINKVNRATKSNRPLSLRARQWWAMIIAPLQGWKSGMFANLSNFLAVSQKLEKTVASNQQLAAVRSMQWLVLAAVLILPFLLFSALFSAGEEEVMRALNMAFFNSASPSRQPWERQGLRSQSIGWFLAGMNGIPYIDMLVNAGLNDMPNRKSLDPSLFVIEQGKKLAKYVGGVVQTGDPLFRLPELVGALVPDSKLVINRLPMREGTREEANVINLARRFGPTDLIRPTTGTTSAGINVTPIAPYLDAMVNYAAAGNVGEVVQNYQAAVGVALSMGKEDPEQYVRQLFAARNPYNIAFKSKLTEGQRASFLSSLTDGQREMVNRVESNWSTAAQAIGGNEPTWAKDERVPSITRGIGLSRIRATPTRFPRMRRSLGRIRSVGRLSRRRVFGRRRSRLTRYR